MDVHCSTCGEPWDTYHLWQDAIHETDLDEDGAEDWRSLPRHEQLSAHYRAHFSVVGWEFGSSVLDVQHCPCCPGDARRDPEKEAMKTAIAEVLGDDDDAIAFSFEEHGL